METKQMTKSDVTKLVGPSQESSKDGSLMLIIDRAARDPQFDVGKLQALLEMRERWSKEEARKAFVVALTDFKADPPEILKTKHVSYSTSGGKTSYNHAELALASAQIGAALSQHGLSHRWNVEQTPEGRIAVTCILTHVLGHSESVRMESQSDQSGGKNNIQAIGSATSYLQRYTLFAAAGVIAKDQEDDDGAVTGSSGPIEGPKPKTATGPQVVTFIPVEVSEKKGKKKDGTPWTKYGIKDPDGNWYGTFSESYGEVALIAKDNNSQIVVEWKQDGEYKNAEKVSHKE